MKNKYFILIILAILYFKGVPAVFAQWHLLPELTHADVKCILTTDDSTVFVGGSHRLLLRSTNNGNDWINIYEGIIQADTILALGKATEYIFIGTHGVNSLYRSSDNGDTWEISNKGLPSLAVVNGFAWIDSVLFLAANYGVYSSTDYGRNWKADTLGLAAAPYNPGQGKGISGITSTGSTIFVIKNWWGGVYESPTDSIMWTPIGLNTIMGYSLASLDANIFAGTQDGIFCYAESNKEWQARNGGLPEYFADCIFTIIDSLLFVYTGDRTGGIYFTSDLGLTWQRIKDSISTSNSINAMAGTDNYLFAATESGAWRYSLGSSPNLIDDKEVHNLKGYFLNQNYPNPFNPKTLIKFNIAGTSRQVGVVSLRVYDLLGREVATLVDGIKSPGEHTVEWHGINSRGQQVGSGIYFYRLNYGDRVVETKKMILLR